MLKICPCCKYVSNLYQTITFTWLLRINTYLANICICPHFSRQRKCNANLELQIYHIFAPFANISKSVFSSSALSTFLTSSWGRCWIGKRCFANGASQYLACSRRLDSGEPVKSYAASAKRNKSGKKEGWLGRERDYAGAFPTFSRPIFSFVNFSPAP